MLFRSLFYQIALHGRSDLSLAPDEYAGFTMTLLRMLTFMPDDGLSNNQLLPASSVNSKPSVDDGKPQPASAQTIQQSPRTAAIDSSALEWPQLIQQA